MTDGRQRLVVFLGLVGGNHAGLVEGGPRRQAALREWAVGEIRRLG